MMTPANQYAIEHTAHALSVPVFALTDVEGNPDPRKIVAARDAKAKADEDKLVADATALALGRKAAV